MYSATGIEKFCFQSEQTRGLNSRSDQNRLSLRVERPNWTRCFVVAAGQSLAKAKKAFAVQRLSNVPLRAEQSEGACAEQNHTIPAKLGAMLTGLRRKMCDVFVCLNRAC